MSTSRLRSILTYAEPSPLEKAARELIQAQRDWLDASAWAEKYAFERDMLDARITRLRAAVFDLSREPDEGAE